MEGQKPVPPAAAAAAAGQKPVEIALDGVRFAVFDRDLSEPSTDDYAKLVFTHYPLCMSFFCE